MKTILLDSSTYRQVRAADGWSRSKTRPRRFFDVLRAAADKINAQILPVTARSVLLEKPCLFSFLPSWLSICGVSWPLATVAYLSWGTPRHSTNSLIDAAKVRAWRFLVRNSTVVLVNDDESLSEVSAIRKGVGGVRKVPYVVDTDFFAPETSAITIREHFILVPGNIDRDEALVLGLAERGIPIVRVFADSRVRGAYANAPGSLQLRENVSWVELRALYHTCAAVFIPITSTNHAAGQTALLEALASGARVVCSASRVVGTVNVGAVEVILEGNADAAATYLNGILDVTTSAGNWEAFDVMKHKYSFSCCVDAMADAFNACF